MDCFEPSFLRAIGEWIYHFQTLLAGIAAVGAAIATICQMKNQMRNVERNRALDNEKRKKKELSNNANNLVFRMREITNDICNLYENITRELPLIYPEPVWPKIPIQINAYKENVMFSDESLSALKTLNELDLLNELHLLSASRNKNFTAMRLYNQRLQEKEELLDKHSKFIGDGKETGFLFPNDDTGLMRFSNNQNTLVLSIITNLEELIDKIIEITPEFNNAISKVNGVNKTFCEIHPKFLKWYNAREVTETEGIPSS